MEEPMIEVRDLYYTYRGERGALNGINLKIYPGEKVAVIGSNGAGKSTFFLNLNGVLRPESGEIYYRGVKIQKKNLNELRKKIGIVFQDADNQIIASTVMAEVSFGPMNLKLPKEEVIKRVDEALAYMNITAFKERPPHYLSGGEKKRVSIADIIAMQPEVIAFDEPAAALDPQNADMLEAVLQKLAQDGKTLLISTHDVDFVYRWAQRAVVFCDGKIIADGTPLEVFRNEAVVRQANLKRPAMLEVYESLVKQGYLSQTEKYPRTPKQLDKLLANACRQL